MTAPKLPSIAELKTEGLWSSHYISAIGLIPIIQQLGPNLIGVEVGACRGENTAKFLEECPNIVHFDVVDPYTEYADPNGGSSQETLNDSKRLNQENLAPFGDRAQLHICTSKEFADKTPAGYYDFVFIDANSSYLSVREDIFAWYSKVKVGGIFSGHNHYLSDVRRAVTEFRQISLIHTPLLTCDNSVWYWVK